MVKYFHEKEKADKITVAIEGDIQTYALSFLHIWNNAREYSNMFYKVENDSGNYVYITCRKKDTKTITEYLENFGKIIDTEEIDYFIIKAEYDFKGWEELFGSNCEVDFAVEID